MVPVVVITGMIVRRVEWQIDGDTATGTGPAEREVAAVVMPMRVAINVMVVMVESARDVRPWPMARVMALNIDIRVIIVVIVNDNLRGRLPMMRAVVTTSPRPAAGIVNINIIVNSYIVPHTRGTVINGCLRRTYSPSASDGSIRFDQDTIGLGRDVIDTYRRCAGDRLGHTRNGRLGARAAGGSNRSLSNRPFRRRGPGHGSRGCFRSRCGGDTPRDRRRGCFRACRGRASGSFVRRFHHWSCRTRDFACRFGVSWRYRLTCRSRCNRRYCLCGRR